RRRRLRLLRSPSTCRRRAPSYLRGAGQMLARKLHQTTYVRSPPSWSEARYRELVEGWLARRRPGFLAACGRPPRPWLPRPHAVTGAGGFDAGPATITTA